MTKLIKNVVHRKDPKRGNSSAVVIKYYNQLWDYVRTYDDYEKDKAFKRANTIAFTYGKSMLIERKGLKETGHGKYTRYIVYQPTKREPRKNANYSKF